MKTPERARHIRLCGLLPALALLAACQVTDVDNPNAPDRTRVFGTAAELEAHVASAFHDWYRAETGYLSVPGMLSAASFQHSTWAVCDGPHADIPRGALPNDEESSCVHSLRAWRDLYDALWKVADGFQVLDARPDLREELGPMSSARLEAFGRFVQGLALGSLALLYDQAPIVDETVDLTLGVPVIGYDQLGTAALGHLSQAARLADGASWSRIPPSWMSVGVAPEQLARLARSFAARYRAALPRSPAERAAVDWSAVLADTEAGVLEDWGVDAEGAWIASAVRIIHQPDRPTQLPYFIAGMADGSGSFQRWLARDPFVRRPFPPSDGEGSEPPILIVTPDLRFPRGSTLEGQTAQPGTLFAVPEERITDEGVDALWGRPERGTWRWSFYRFTGADAYAGSIDGRWPLFTEAELRLLRAEAFLRLGSMADAASLVNLSRTAAGLDATDGSGTNTDCVPRLPDGTCGDLLEMLKWEKRLETQWTGPFLSSWYFDGRGWGDLHWGTFLQLPIPCEELVVLRRECYTFGGGAGAGSAPGSVYEWPYESPGSTPATRATP